MKTALMCVCLALPLALPSGASTAAQETTEKSTSDLARERFEALEAEAEAAYEAWLIDIRKQMAEAEENGGDMSAISFDGPLGPFVERFQAGATEYAGTEDAVQFLVWLTQSGMQSDREAGKAAFTTLFEQHTKSKGLEKITDSFPYLAQIFDKKRAAELLAKVEAESESPSVRGWAANARLASVLEEADITSPEFIAAKTEIMGLVATLNDKGLSSQVAFKLRVRESFSIGMVAPDIDGIDLDGAAFKLSDYKGKVLFVDFWGDW